MPLVPGLFGICVVGSTGLPPPPPPPPQAVTENPITAASAIIPKSFAKFFIKNSPF
jgi:hypothetical protein